MAESPYKIIVERVNCVRMRVHCKEECVHEELSEFFKYPDPSYANANSWQKRKWDGMIRLYDKRSGLIDIGLLKWVLKFAQINNYPIEVDPRLKHVRHETEDTLKEYIDSLNLTRYDEDGESIPLVPWDYQYKGVHYAIKHRRKVLLAATGAGKSLMQYILTRYYLDEALATETDAKVLLVVPSQLLVTQMLDNFVEYSVENGWDAESNCHLIYDGATKFTNKKVVISTWQGIQDEDKDFFKQFTHLMVDEVHGASAKKVSHICNSCIHAEDRIGMTGTLKDTELHELQVTAHFGSTVTVVTTKELQDMGQASDTLITMVNCDYQDSDRKFVNNLDYQGEIDSIIDHPYRNHMIVTFARSLEGNTLLLFDRIRHVEMIADELRKYKDNVYIINGDVDQAERDRIKKLTEKGDNYTILATYGTMSTGVSIRKLHNLVFCHPSKSIIRILQSVGRLIRMHSSKKCAFIYDLVDNFKVKGGESNHALKHGLARYTYYVRQEHKVRSKKYMMQWLLKEEDRERILKETKRRIAMKALRDN